MSFGSTKPAARAKEAFLLAFDSDCFSAIVLMAANQDF
jgi:hypothetical protein